MGIVVAYMDECRMHIPKAAGLRRANACTLKRFDGIQRSIVRAQPLPQQHAQPLNREISGE